MSDRTSETISLAVGTIQQTAAACDAFLIEVESKNVSLAARGPFQSCHVTPRLSPEFRHQIGGFVFPKLLITPGRPS